MTVDDNDQDKLVSLNPDFPELTRQQCYAKMREMITLAEEAEDIDRKAKLLLAAAEWLRRARVSKPG